MITGFCKNMIIRVIQIREKGGEDPAGALENFGILTAEENAEIVEAN